MGGSSIYPPVKKRKTIGGADDEEEEECPQRRWFHARENKEKIKVTAEKQTTQLSERASKKLKKRQVDANPTRMYHPHLYTHLNTPLVTLVFRLKGQRQI